MRKVTALLFSFFSVLLVWGQNEGQFDFESVKQIINGLKVNQSTVLDQASKASQISSEDKGKANSVLTAAFASLDKVINVYQNLQENPELESEAQKIIGEFLDAYQTAIYDDNKSEIKIRTRSFLTVAENSTPQFEDFYKKAHKYIVQHPKETNDEEKENEGNQETYSADPDVNLESEKENSAISIWDWIAMGLGIIGVIVGFYAIICVNVADKRITERRKEINEMESRLMQRINEIKPSGYRGPTASSHVSKSQYTPKPQVKRKEAIVVSPPRKDESRPQQIVGQRPNISNLFATIKAGSPLAEFFKVSAENTGDKVFMLTLASPDTEVADFTIVPNMAPDFMKSVIVDRDTYLPAIFCEKSIDSQNPSRIEVLSQGRAKKVDGKWQVQERMSIRLV